nr:hypothetical protein [Neisseria flavescens]
MPSPTLPPSRIPNRPRHLPRRCRGRGRGHPPLHRH